LFLLIAALFPALSSSAQKKWGNNPFEQKVFIENKGQFTDPLQNLYGFNNTPSVASEKILFGGSSNGVEMYFTATGLTYKHNEMLPMTEDERGEYSKLISVKESAEEEEFAETFTRSVPRYLKIEWLNANPNTQIVSSDAVSFYYTYGGAHKDANSTIKANAFQKITYKNIYPNIDVEYIFPKDSSGIKYSLILHPGANPADIKMKYKNAEQIFFDSNGNLKIETALGEFIDHAPITFYADNQKKIPSSFNLNKNIVSFNLPSFNQAKHISDIIIDPWTSNPTYAGFNSAYDVNFDLAGNVYVYGSYSPYKLAKFNSAGALLWTYNAVGLGFQLAGRETYGDFATDEISGSCYLVEGLRTAGAMIYKVNNAGIQIVTFAGDPNFEEMWRVEYNRCINKMVVAGGGHVTYQGATIDTLLTPTSVTPVNVVGALFSIYHDFVLLTLDNATNDCYMATAQPGSGSNFDNLIYKCPIPALTPATFTVPSLHRFREVRSVAYVNNFTSAGTLVPANGMNGMASSPKWLYTYNSDSLKRWDKVTGAYIAGINIDPLPPVFVNGGLQIRWGGLSVDECDNIYVGIGNTVQHYNSSLALVTTYNLPNTVIDVKLGLNNKLYVCGVGFVEEITVVGNPPATATFTPASSCLACDGTATATPACGGVVGYSWNSVPVQTAQTATNLCPGTYTVTISYTCANTETATITIPGFNSPAVNLVTQKNVTCNGGSDGAATVAVVGGVPPYTYSWNTVPVQNTLAITSVPAGVYVFSVTDSTGCTVKFNVTITQPPAINAVTSFVAEPCGINSAEVVASGGNGGPFTYLWSTTPALTTDIITPVLPGTYTVTVADNKGCTKTQTVIVVNAILPVSAEFTAVGSPVFGVTQTSAQYLFNENTINASFWNWDFGDPASGLSNTSTLQNPTHDYTSTATYCVTLIATHINGTCKDTVTKCFEIGCEWTFYVPNTFTPNNDGTNDVFGPKGICLKKYNMLIFDRWGNQIFETEDINIGWDGRANKGKEIAQQDVYVYKINIIDSYDIPHQYRGTVTLVK